MSNTYFQFKQFTIHQEKAALKVCTDACIFGAWVAKKIPSKGRVLDIGAGTGLLMMMVSQQSKLPIDGIEIDPDSYEQAQTNIAAGPWKHRMQLFFGDIKSYPLPIAYDFILSNPPFFENDLISGQQNEQIAKHSTALTLQELVFSIKKNLTVEGQFAVLLPYHRHDYFKKIALESGYHLNEYLLVKQHEQHPSYFRSICIYSCIEQNHTPTIISIRNDQNQYTQEFTTLLKEYYLHL